jgi:predicted nucleic acid-binding Zn ribbon protein
LSDKRRPIRLEEALDAYFARSGIKRRVAQARVVAEWKTLVGPAIADVTTAHAVTADGTLHVSVKTAAWMQELQLMSPTILRQLHQRGKHIKRIVWRAE